MAGCWPSGWQGVPAASGRGGWPPSMGAEAEPREIGGSLWGGGLQVRRDLGQLNGDGAL